MSRMQNLLDEIRELEERVSEEISREAEELGYTVKKGRVRFEQEIARRHKEMAVGLREYIGTASWLTLLTAPLVYSLLFPLLVLDLFVSFYQWICFPIYRIPCVKRGEYMALDRHRLKYLNAIQKVHCVYCSYGNGLLAYAQEIASRTEQYWCPIKHAKKVKGVHVRYYNFVPYGDAEGYAARLAELRKKLQDESKEKDKES